MNELTIRICCPEDEAALRRLAELDTADPLEGRVLAAEVGGELLAALSLESGRAIADPFRRTAELVDLLRKRERQLRGARDWRPLPPDPASAPRPASR